MRAAFGLGLGLRLVLALFAGIVGAEERDAALCEAAIAGGAARGGVPEAVLHAISLTETGRAQEGRLRPWPWAVNLDGQGHWFASRAEALDFARRSLAEGRRSFDVGCFQINHHWHGEAFPSLEAMFDPDLGADYAAQFLRELFSERGDWSAAAGAYHSQTPHLASAYRARFDRNLAGLGDAEVVVAAGKDPEPPRKSRTRMSGRPRIITIERGPAGAPPMPGPGETARAGPEEAILVSQDWRSVAGFGR